MSQTSFYTRDELLAIGFKCLGDNVLLSRFARIYKPEIISIGNNVRIDDFCILSGNIRIGNYVHIAAACLLFGGNDGIVFEDYTGLSSRSAVYAESDDYSGQCFTNPMLPMKYRHIIGGGVVVKKHAIIGSGCTILPNVVIGEGCAVGSMSLVNRSQDAWSVCVGIPCKRIKDRNIGVLQLVHEFED
jgi:galactoside O-acetyltransferase